jgi:multiple sugar transport system substrate-binding protein
MAALRVSTLAMLALCSALLSLGCAEPSRPVLTISGSAVGLEAEVIRRQLDRFHAVNPAIEVALRATPDAADERHQLYVQWLNARASDPDVLQLDVVWTPEFAAAGWLAPLDTYAPPVTDFFPASIIAARWNHRLYALPWFVDVGMLYWRTDILPRAPETLADLTQLAAAAQRDRGIPFGFVWQGARYEGLVTVFLEHLGAFGGTILDDEGRVVVDSEAAERALTFMRDAVHTHGVVPAAALTWREEQTRFAFQTGQAAFMRNWPYAYSLLQDGSQSSVAGRFAVTALPAAPGGQPTAALGGAVLAVNAWSDQKDDAYALIEFLLQPAQMLERARVSGQYPSRPALYDSLDLVDALPVPIADVRAVIERAVPRPATPIYAQLSDILQVRLHRVLTRQSEPRPALREAAAAMRAALAKAGLASGL